MTVFLDDIGRWDGDSHGSYEVTAAEIVEFAEQYDPQWFHTDPDRAADSIYGDLIASGWHTASMSMRLFVDGFLAETATLGAKGLDHLRWPRPVVPGDELTIHSAIHGIEEGDGTDDYGVVRWGVETTANDGAKTVLDIEALVLVARE
ncbi:MaoC/PaaZ C-terminal domain-containing protein [Haloplanus natans]|uniref:MaoC/PaaZ C-terminal domain-containing protein n=1 Tax=Haloplanus natans TaxID=376171 RepID=UPI0006776358|nr:MaoC/PaaZ C-terminal domain-containing protein [Haloplanus natans]